MNIFLKRWSWHLTAQRTATLLMTISSVCSLLAEPVAPRLRTDFAEETCGWKSGDTLIHVPASVRELPPFAFADMTELREVTFEGRGLEKVGEYAFLGCGSLRGITLPETVRELGEGCFRECGSLRSLRVPGRVRQLPRFMCEWDSLLESVSLPSGLQDIGSHAFAYCTSLESIEIPSGVTHIGSNAFSFCSQLHEVTVPDAVTELESYAFSECTSLRRAVLPANPSLLGELIFSGCRNLEELVELSPTPPKFDCDSYIFEPDETALYARCTLTVTPAARVLYTSSHGWRLFTLPAGTPPP